MNAKLHSLWSILAHDGVGDAIGDARPTFVVSRDGRLLHFANAAGARFLGLAPARALDARVALEPRIADRLARFVAGSTPGDTGRELIRFFDGLRSTLLSVGFRRAADDAVLVTVDNARNVAADADPAASLAAIAAEGGLVALFDGDGEVVAALGDHAALDGVQDDIEAALDAEDGAPVFERRIATAGHAHDVALVRLGSADRPRRLLRVGPAVAVAEAAPRTTDDAAPIAPLAAAPLAAVVPAEAVVAPDSEIDTAAPLVADETPSTAATVPPVPLLPEPETPAVAHDPAGATEDLALAVAAVTSAEIETDPVAPSSPLAAPLALVDLEAESETLAAAAETVSAFDETEWEGASDVEAEAEAEPPIAATLHAEADETDEDAETDEVEDDEIASLEVPAADLIATHAGLDAEIETAIEEEPEVTADDAPEASTEARPEAEAEPAEEPATAADETPDASAEAAPAAGFRYRPAGRAVKFVWQMDAERRFTLISNELAAVVGPEAAAVVGRSWREVADDLGLDGDGRVASALERRDTWSGRTVLWPVEGEALRLPVDLAALPAFDRGRVFTGYRGFGTIRGEEAIPDPTATGLRLAAAAAPIAAPTTDLRATEATATDDDTAPAAPTPSEPTALVGEPPSATEADLEPPAYPDDSEAQLAAEHDHRPEKPASEDGEAAFAGEIDGPAAVAAPAAPVATLPDLWLDDELALAMATLPACAEADDAETETAVAAPEAETSIEAAHEASAAPLVAPATDAAEADAEIEAEEIAPAATEAEREDDAVARFAALPPVSPLALHAVDLDDDADEVEDSDEEEDTTATIVAEAVAVAPFVEDEAATPPAEIASVAATAETAAAPTDIAPTTGEPAESVEAEAPESEDVDTETVEAEAIAAGSEPSDHPEPSSAASRRERLAQAPASLRAAVAEISERAAELEPRIILPAHGEPDAGSTTTEAAPAAALDVATPTAVDGEAKTAAPEASAAIAAPRHEATGADEPPTATAAPLVDLPRDDAPIVPRPVSDTSSKIVALTSATRPPAEATRLSPPEHVAFRQIAEALGARIEGEDGVRRPAAPVPSPRPEAPSADAAPSPAARPAPTTVDTRLLDRLPGAVAVVKDENLIYGNDAFLRLLGYPDLAALDAAGGLDALFAGEHVARRWGAGPDGARPVPVLAHDGRVIPVDATVSTVPWSGGSALMLTLTEVTPAAATPADAPAPADETPVAAETPAAPAAAPLDAPATLAAPAVAGSSETSLRQRVAELEAIIDTATDGVLLLDADGTILSANHTAEALFGADRREMIGRPLADRLAPESRRSAMDYLDGLARNGVASVLNDGREVIGVVERGGLIPLFMTIGRLSAEPARKYCAVLRDITQWKKSEEELTAARRRAEEASVHKSDFLAKISHEIRTPLNAIIGFSEVMMDERFGPVGNDRYKDYLRDIHSSGSHIMSLINDLLDLSKVEAGKMDLRFEAVALGDIMSECVAMMQPQANRERIIIRSSLPAGVPAVVADPRSVRQVVLNLLSNAIKFTPSGGQVIVSTTLEDSGEVVMRVRDTGYGMTDKELQTAMEPFRQLHTTRSRGGGTGLGLPLTKALVEANRAVFRLDSTVGQGTLATVTFPVTRVLAS